MLSSQSLHSGRKFTKFPLCYYLSQKFGQIRNVDGFVKTVYIFRKLSIQIQDPLIILNYFLKKPAMIRNVLDENPEVFMKVSCMIYVSAGL